MNSNNDLKNLKSKLLYTRKNTALQLSEDLL